MGRLYIGEIILNETAKRHLQCFIYSITLLFLFDAAFNLKFYISYSHTLKHLA